MCFSACLRHFRGDYNIIFNGKVETITLLTQMFPLNKVLEFALDYKAFQRGELAAKMLSVLIRDAPHTASTDV